MFQINSTRDYREGGERRTFSQTILAEWTTPGEAYRVVEVIAEENRPTFDLTSRPTGGTILPSSAARRFATGEFQEVG